MKRARWMVACGVMAAMFLGAGLAGAVDETEPDAGTDSNWAKKAADAGKKAAETANQGKKPATETAQKSAADARKEAAEATKAAAEARKEAEAKRAAAAAEVEKKAAETAKKPAASTANADAAKPAAASESATKAAAKKNPEKRKAKRAAAKKAAEAKKAEEAKKAAGETKAPAPARPVVRKPAPKAPASKPVVVKPPPAGAVQVARIATVAATVIGKDAVLDECQIETALPTAIAERNPNVFLIDKPTANGTVLSLKIVDLRAPGGGILSGPRSITVDGRLVSGGKLKGTFEGKQSSMGSMTNCGMISKVIFELAGDIGAWIDQPSMNAQLGNAR